MILERLNADSTTNHLLYDEVAIMVKVQQAIILQAFLLYCSHFK